MASDGDLVAFCDDDDAWRPGKIARQVALLAASGAEFVCCGTRFHYTDRVVERPAPPVTELAQLVRYRFPEMGAPTFLMRRAALDAIGLLLRAAKRGPIMAVPEPLIDVYWHPQSFFADRYQTIVDGLRYLLDKHPEIRTDRRGLARIQGQIAFAQAALSRRTPAMLASGQALANNPLERRAYVALAVASGAVRPASVARMANRRGRGI